MRRIEGGNKVQKTPLFVRLERFNILWYWILTSLFQALMLASLYLEGDTPKCTLKHLEKYLGELKPRRYVMSDIFKSGRFISIYDAFFILYVIIKSLGV